MFKNSRRKVRPMAQDKQISVIDDDLEMASLVEDILKGQGYSVSSYTSASEALVQFKKNPPQVVITDLNMKDVSGMMLLKKVQTDYPHSASIMMTAFGSIETAIEA